MKLRYLRLSQTCVFACLSCLFVGHAAAQVATPILSPGTVTSTSSFDVTITTETAGASIRYTTNGSTPSSTTGTLYSSPVTISSTQTIKAIAYKTAMTDSEIATAVYTIVTPPSISSISPASGSPGTQITVSGSAFGSTQGTGAVWLGTALATVSSWSDTQIVATVASNSATGSVRVRQNGVWSNSESLEIAGITIDSVTPDYGLPGTSVTIAGSGFGFSQGSGKLLLGTLLGTITSWSDTQIVATVAAHSEPGYVQVLKDGRMSNFGEFFFWVTTPFIYSVSPDSAYPSTTVTISGSSFGATQGTGSVWLGSKAATVLTWTDTEITAVVESGSKSGVVRVQQNSYQSNVLKFSVPDGLGAISTLAPDSINMTVGETRSIQALDEEGDILTGLTWASSDTGVVTLSASDPPVLTAVAAGHATITAGSASADVTVFASSLPTGAVLWLNTLGGQYIDSFLPAVPSPTGVADLFAISGDQANVITALTSDGMTTWTRTLSDEQYHAYLTPDFQGGLIDIVGGGGSSPASVSKLDGLTGQTVSTYTTSESAYTGDPAIHPDGTVFLTYQPVCDYCVSRLVGIDSSDGTEKFNVELPPAPPVNLCDSFTHGQPIIAGDGYAYLPYATWECLPGLMVHHRIAVLRASTSGSITRIPLTDFYGAFYETMSTSLNVITNADTGVLVTWKTTGINAPAFGMAVTNGTSVSSVATGAVAAGQMWELKPVLQAQDGSFVGTTQTTDAGWLMIAFEPSGSVRWMVPIGYDVPETALANGSVVMQSGLVYDENGVAIGYSDITYPTVDGWLSSILGQRYLQWGGAMAVQGPNTQYADSFAAGG